MSLSGQKAYIVKVKMGNWVESKLRKPPQGKKVICFNKGDVTIRQRFKDYWFPIPFIDSKFADIEQPELWQEIDFPDGFTGSIRISFNGSLLNMDEIEKENPDIFNQIIEMQINLFNETRQSKAALHEK